MAQSRLHLVINACISSHLVINACISSHLVINARIEPVLGAGESLRSCFRYLNGRDGERAMKEARLPPNHRDMLLYFASIILDPEGHRRWMDAIRNDPRR